MHNNGVTFGVEIELFVVNKDGGLYDLTDAQRNAISDINTEDKITFEYKACQIEVRSNPSSSGQALLIDLQTTISRIDECLSAWGLATFMGGTHPTGCWKQAQSRPDDRYRKIEGRKGDAVKQLLASGLHVHVGTISDPDAQVRRVRQYWPITPMLVALTPSSSYWNGSHTDWVSWRRIILGALDVSVPPLVDTRCEYDDHIQNLIALDAADAETDLWVDVRPGRDDLPTVEFRSPDVSPALEDNVAVAVFLGAIEWCARQDHTFLAPSYSCRKVRLIEISIQLAAKRGMSAKMWNAYDSEVQPVRDFAANLLSRVRPGLEACGNIEWADHLERMIGTTAQQRAA